SLARSFSRSASRASADARCGPRRRRFTNARAALSAQGIAAATIDAALAGEDAEVELDAARAFVKRRRLGPHRASAEAREAEREKDLARLGRAGFSFAVALRALSSEHEA
ncbi:MAG TPA: RecX family transcriptional regulator, partial [Polyangium sp.]|nr:RecX family transcriptional regulator [Polyangium sp.]